MGVDSRVLSALKKYAVLTLRELCCAVNGRPLDGSYCRQVRCRYVYHAGDHSRVFNKQCRRPDCTWSYIAVIHAVRRLEEKGLVHTAKKMLPDDLSPSGYDRFTIVRLGPKPKQKSILEYV